MWFIHESAKGSVNQANSRIHSVEPAIVQAAIDARVLLASDQGPDIYSKVGTVAQIMVSGVLTKQYSYYYGMFGGGSTSYYDISACIALAEADEAIESIELHVSSGGGRVDGMTDAIDAIRGAEKPVTAIVDGMAASAAYAIAAAADKILAVRSTDLTGSVGVVQDWFFWNAEEIVSVTNTESPDKRPDVRTTEGFKVVQEELDPVHDLIVDGIAEGRSAATGRNITADIVNSDFGKGRVFIASEAIKNGMIDGFVEKVEKSEKVVNNASLNKEITSNQKTEKKVDAMSEMTLEKLKAEHPEIYNQIVASERDRCSAHLKGGMAADLLDKSIAHIDSGVEVTSSIMMDYSLGAQNKTAAGDRVEDNIDTGTVAKTTVKTAAEATKEQLVEEEEEAVAEALANGE